MSPSSPSGLDEATLDAIVDAVVGRVRQSLGSTPVQPHGRGGGPSPADSSPGRRAPAYHPARGAGVHDDLDHAVRAAREAFEAYEAMPLATRYSVVEAMRRAGLAHVDEMSERAARETGLGRAEDKRIKNRVALTKTPGPKFLDPMARSGDDGLMLMERAPFGVITSITPCTNPTETIANNAIGMVAAGNAVLFNVHPLAKQTSAWFVSLLNEAIRSAGGPPSLLNCVAEPSIESAQAAMRHPGVRLVVVTGGGAVVTEAFRSGKRAVCAGPGNPPVVVDETAHLDVAGRGIVAGASFDNNVICTDEKVVVAVRLHRGRPHGRDGAQRGAAVATQRAPFSGACAPRWAGAHQSGTSSVATPAYSSAPATDGDRIPCVSSSPTCRRSTPSCRPRC